MGNQLYRPSNHVPLWNLPLFSRENIIKTNNKLTVFPGTNELSVLFGTDPVANLVSKAIPLSLQIRYSGKLIDLENSFIPKL